MIFFHFFCIFEHQYLLSVASICESELKIQLQWSLRYYSVKKCPPCHLVSVAVIISRLVKIIHHSCQNIREFDKNDVFIPCDTHKCIYV